MREIKSHLKKQLTQFKTSQNNIDKAKNSFLYVLEGVTDFGVTKIIVKKVKNGTSNCSQCLVVDNNSTKGLTHYLDN